MHTHHYIYHWAKGPEAPTDFKITDVQETQVTLDWKKSELATQGGVSYTVSLIKLFFFVCSAGENFVFFS